MTVEFLGHFALHAASLAEVTVSASTADSTCRCSGPFPATIPCECSAFASVSPVQSTAVSVAAIASSVDRRIVVDRSLVMQLLVSS